MFWRLALWLGKQLNIGANMGWLQIRVTSPKTPRASRAPKSVQGTAHEEDVTEAHTDAAASPEHDGADISENDDNDAS